MALIIERTTLPQKQVTTPPHHQLLNRCSKISRDITMSVSIMWSGFLNINASVWLCLFESVTLGLSLSLPLSVYIYLERFIGPSSIFRPSIGFQFENHMRTSHLLLPNSIYAHYCLAKKVTQLQTPPTFKILLRKYCSFLEVSRHPIITGFYLSTTWVSTAYS